MPETKGIPTEEMDSLFAKRPQRHAHRMVLEDLRARGAENRGEAVLNTYQQGSNSTSSAELEKDGDINQVKINTA